MVKPRPMSALAVVRPPGGGLRTRNEGSKPAHQTILEAFLRRTSPRTQKVYREGLEAFARWGGFDDDLAEMTRALFALSAPEAHERALAYLQHLTDEGYAPNTIGIRLTALRGLVTLGQQLGAVLWRLEVRGPKTENIRDTRGPELEAVRTLLRSTTSAKDQAILRLLFECGLRNIEVCELRMEHLKLESAEVFVRGKGKTGLHPISISPALVGALRKWLPQRKHGVGFERPESFVFFPRRDALKQLNGSTMGSLVKRLGTHANIRLWPHALRHSAITALLDATSGDVRAVQKFSRHQNVNTVIRYDDDRRNLGATMRSQLADLVKE